MRAIPGWNKSAPPDHRFPDPSRAAEPPKGHDCGWHLVWRGFSLPNRDWKPCAARARHTPEEACKPRMRLSKVRGASPLRARRAGLLASATYRRCAETASSKSTTCELCICQANLQRGALWIAKVSGESGSKRISRAEALRRRAKKVNSKFYSLTLRLRVSARVNPSFNCLAANVMVVSPPAASHHRWRGGFADRSL